jgi:hypothetical protein
MGALIVPSIEAAIMLANYIQSSYALYSAGHMTDAQLADAWKAAGVSVQAAGTRLQAAEDAARARAAAPQTVTAISAPHA